MRGTWDRWVIRNCSDGRSGLRVWRTIDSTHPSSKEVWRSMTTLITAHRDRPREGRGVACQISTDTDRASSGGKGAGWGGGREREGRGGETCVCVCVCVLVC